MVDILMCTNGKCPRKLKCYRFMAIPDMIQSYGELPCISEDSKIDFFLEIEGRRIRSKIDPETAPGSTY